ncbi:hypothetical protein [Deinococcus roseus]|uniref:Uncharacterized protein n=1 Tax=Deinococcus roseus TaxID=392414 RepID=A0ABQ2CVL0_9DEIO|nr:hypothetical protein [Deinococcus roseus]GGJ21434.1 hypothetical protein GCM10008938_04550 [Deinococcus roseus]
MLSIDLLDTTLLEDETYPGSPRHLVHLEFTYGRNEDINKNHNSTDFSNLMELYYTSLFTNLKEGQLDFDSHVYGWAEGQHFVQDLGHNRYRFEGCFEDTPVVQSILQDLHHYQLHQRYVRASRFTDAGHFRRLLNALVVFWA